MAKKAYKELCKEIQGKVKASGSSRASKSDMVDMTKGLLNDPDHKYHVYNKNTPGQSVEVQPSKKFRDAMKPVLEDFGVDKNEAQKMDTYEFGNKQAEAISDLALFMVKDTLDVGRKVQLPMTTEDESLMAFERVDVPERVSIPKKFVEVDGQRTTVPGDKEVTTARHYGAKATNRIPGWLKSEKPLN